MQMARRLAFEEFNEGAINFAPTYKYDPGTDVYDSSEKKRTPAWCDRVMWRGRNMKQINYLRHELLASDHRPVSATFEIQVKSVNAEKRNSAYQEIVKKLDKLENECMPDATVSSNNVTFNNVRYALLDAVCWLLFDVVTLIVHLCQVHGALRTDDRAREHGQGTNHVNVCGET
jgi:phosphatidylinositol-bisphosphatase